MTRNPLVNAFAAAAYIAGIASLLMYGLADKGQGIIVPITMLSLLVLSVLVMGYTLLLAPLLLCFEGKLRDATTLFVQTLGAFAGITALLVIAFVLL